MGAGVSSQRKRGKSGPPDRSAYLKELVLEQKRLPAALKSGQYQAITHDTVLRRLEVLPNVSGVVKVDAYKAALKALRGKGYRSHRHSAGHEEKRQFYLVRFTVVSMDGGAAYNNASKKISMSY